MTRLLTLQSYRARLLAMISKARTDIRQAEERIQRATVKLHEVESAIDRAKGGVQ